MTDRRMDGWARRLARPDSELIVSHSRRGAANGEPRLDGVARTLAAPITRRRAVGLIGGTVLAASLLRPGRARADCFPGGPKTCTNPHGAKVCVPENLQCCSNENCAIACPYPWRVCASPSRCDDTAAMCQPANHAEAGVGDANRTKFCSATVGVTNGCVESKQGEAIRGWCCRPNEDCELAREEFGICLCPDGPKGPRDCDDKCCPKDQICVRSRAGTFCKAPCPDGWQYDEDGKCVCSSGQTCGLKCCPEGKVCQSNKCVSPLEPSGPFKDLFKGLRNFFGSDSGSQSAGSHAGGNYLKIGRAAAGPGSTPVRSALLLLGAVNAQGAAAALAITDHHVDRSYRRKVTAAKPSLPKLAGSGLPPAAAAALDTLLAAEAKAFAQIFAAATALARSRGALKARKNAQARTQALAAARFASSASSALKKLPGLRSTAAGALRAAGVAEVNVAAADVADFNDSVKTSGLPADLTTLLKGLGMSSADLKLARSLYQGQPTGGPALIAPLTDSARSQNLTKLAGELSKYARSLRRSPITRSSPRPRRLNPPRTRSSRRR